MYDLGDNVILTFTTHTSAGVLADATSVALTLVASDGTVSTPSVTHPSTGTYTATLSPALAGRYTYRWLATGSNPGASAGVFDIVDSDPRMIISLDDARQALDYDAANTVHDDEITFYIRSATNVIENIAGPVLRRSATETFSGGSAAVLLTQAPILSITTVVEDGVTLAASDYSLNSSAAILVRVTGGVPGVWSPSMYQNISVTYLVGRVDIPANIQDAAREYVRHRAHAKQGKRPQFGTTEAGDVVTSSGYAVPRRVYELLQGTDRLPGFA